MARVAPTVDRGSFVVLYLVGLAGLRRQLRAIATENPSEIYLRAFKSNPDRKDVSLAWPNRNLFPDSNRFWPSKSTTFALALLLAWCSYVASWSLLAVTEFEIRDIANSLGLEYSQAYALTDQRMQDSQRKIQATYGILIAIGIGSHLALFLASYRSPINPWGRLLTGRWVIPGYDRVFLAPLAATIVAIVLPPALDWYEMPVQFLYPLSLATALLVIRNVGPELSDWQLTGEHRLSTGFLLFAGSFLRG